MLFPRAKAWAISEGRKTVVFRATMPKNRTIGKTYAVQVKPDRRGERPGAPLATIKLVSCRTIALAEVDDADARRAGYMDRQHFKQRWVEAGNLWDPARTIWRSEFQLISSESKVKVPA